MRPMPGGPVTHVKLGTRSPRGGRAIFHPYCRDISEVAERERERERERALACSLIGLRLERVQCMKGGC